MIVSELTYSNYFGAVSKVRWYRITDYFNTYNVDVFIHTSQTQNSQAQIQNRASFNGTEWVENVPGNTTQQVIGRQVTITHVPGLKAREYVLINQTV